jgi:hypothetical protein
LGSVFLFFDIDLVQFLPARWLALSIILWAGWPPTAFSESYCGGCVDLIGEVDAQGSTEIGNTTAITAPTPSSSSLGIAVLDTGVQLHAPMSTSSRISLSSDGNVEGYASLFGIGHIHYDTALLHGGEAPLYALCTSVYPFDAVRDLFHIEFESHFITLFPCMPLHI